MRPREESLLARESVPYRSVATAVLCCLRTTDDGLRVTALLIIRLVNKGFLHFSVARRGIFSHGIPYRKAYFGASVDPFGFYERPPCRARDRRERDARHAAQTYCDIPIRTPRHTATSSVSPSNRACSLYALTVKVKRSPLRRFTATQHSRLP